MKVMPNQIIAHRTPAEAWRWACSIVNTYGDKVITEDRKVTKEVRNLMVQLLEPGESWPIPGSNWDLPGLEKYAEQFLSGLNETGFAYTYGERLVAYASPWLQIQPVNQIHDSVIVRLNNEKNTRRAIATTWMPWFDPYNADVPCLQLVDFLYRQNKLHLSAIFRSQDIARAFPANAYGLWKLLCYVGQEAGMEPGSLTIMAVSAHIYEI